MGKVKVINKSRKNCKCGKCGNIIPIGSKYYRGEVNFHPDIIRCASCGLQSWEVTSSDYILSVGPIVYDWSETYSADISGVEDIISDLQEIRDALQDNLDNMPEGLQQGETGELLQCRIDSIESAISELASIEEDEMKTQIIDDNYDNDDEKCDPKWDDLEESIQIEFESILAAAFAEEIQCALDEIEM